MLATYKCGHVFWSRKGKYNTLETAKRQLCPTCDDKWRTRWIIEDAARNNKPILLAALESQVQATTSQRQDYATYLKYFSGRGSESGDSHFQNVVKWALDCLYARPHSWWYNLPGISPAQVLFNELRGFYNGNKVSPLA